MAKSQTRSTARSARKKKRRPQIGGYTCGDEKRAKIIAAGLEVFGALGFDGASTRMLAESAGVNLPALQYYFDDKEGVYLACAEHIADQIKIRLGPTVEHVMHQLSRSDLSREELIDTLWEFLSAYCDLFLSAGEIENWILFILREQARPTKAFEIIFDRMLRFVATACTGMVGRLLELPATDPRTVIRTTALLGQIMVFRFARAMPLRVLGWPNFDGDALTLVKATLRDHVVAAFSDQTKKTTRGKK